MTSPHAAVLSLLLLLLPATSVAQQGEDFAPRRLYNTALGCGGCHGEEAQGVYGPRLRGTGLPLRAFLRQVRAPRAAMPAYVPRYASDARLIAVYAWLGGRDSVGAPLPLQLELPAIIKVAPEEPIEGTLGVPPAASGAAASLAASARYRLYLAQRDGSPLAGHAVRFRAPRARRWNKATTDADGTAFLGGAGSLLPSDEGTEPARLHVAGLPLGRYALIVEALTPDEAGNLRLVGIGSVPVVVW